MHKIFKVFLYLLTAMTTVHSVELPQELLKDNPHIIHHIETKKKDKKLVKLTKKK